MNAEIFIKEKYDMLKNLIKRICGGLDEDIFHDTTTRFLVTLVGSDMDERGLINYFVTSYRQNLSREKLYHRNLLKSEGVDVNTLKRSASDSNMIEMDNIINFVEDTYGLEMANALLMSCEGYSVREIEEETGISGMAYRLSKIKERIKRYYGNEIGDMLDFQ